MHIPLAARVTINDPRIRVTLADGRTRRDGGKPAAPHLLKLVKPTGKRADFLRWFLEDDARTVSDCMTHFGMSRANVFAYWTMIHRDHGIGYRLQSNRIAVVLPEGATAANIFKARS